MNRNRTVCILLAGIFLILFAAGNSFAEQRKGGGYIAVKPGVYFPAGDLDDKGFVKSFTGELTIGTYYTPNLALEAAVGYFRTQAAKRRADFTEEDDFWTIPVTITFKGVLPMKGFELTAGGGGGVYFANIDAEGNTATGTFSRDDSATAWGLHAVAGANVDLSKRIFLGVEGKYIVTTTARLLGTKVNLNGFLVTGVVGYRF